MERFTDGVPPATSGTAGSARPGTPDDLVLPLASVGGEPLARVGGKAANLGRLAVAGFPVPGGFVLTTEAYRRAAPPELDTVARRLDELGPAEAADRERLAHGAREMVGSAAVPEEVDSAVRAAYALLGPGAAVAVRSSATAEDLPFASFAGQQDSFIGVRGADAVVRAVRACWASLWNDRAVAYRAENGIAHRDAGLAVVVQSLVDARAAGVMFTANPTTGSRSETVVDASAGPGQAVVSGSVNPDHFVLHTATGRVLEFAAGGAGPGAAENGPGAPVLSEARVRELAALGQDAQRLFGAPQDVEWVIDEAHRIWLTQSRAVTTLYPLPEDAADDDAADRGVPRLYLCATLVQGLTRPVTPAGLALLGRMRNTEGRWRYVNPGLRMYVDLSPMLRSRAGRRAMLRMLPLADGRSATVFRALLRDPRFARTNGTRGGARPTRRPPSGSRRGARRAAGAGSMAALAAGLLPAILRAVARPEAELRRALGYESRLRELLALPEPASPAERLRHAEDVVGRTVDGLVRATLPGPSAGYLMLAAARGLLRGIEDPRRLEAVLRGLPHNVTTEMNLALWAASAAIGEDAAAREAFARRTPAQLSDDYRAGRLPRAAQAQVVAFLGRYGDRAVAEIDVGMPRWSEQPDHVLGMISNYLRLADPEQAPDRLFAGAADRAEERIRSLVASATARGRLRGRLLEFSLGRVRRLAGLRELPKFYIVKILGEVHRQLAVLGAELARSGSVSAPADVFFLDFDEVRVGLRGADLRPLVADRRRLYDVELRRRRIPRLLLADGTDLEAAVLARGAAASAPAADGVLTGTAASAGSATGRVRVVDDPVGARLEPGEILVAPSADPGWTPLFMTAGALVMEMGGVISHAAVVAREYGIPAVVGVADATSLLRTGQLVTVDGATGTITPAPG
ncbi:MAG: PEP/pyruvate-binding domain-containing protein [Arthrobacter sp.]|uniref:PEP/pyruvate-binding domain-containing protein n=1 Tax=Arthrobacter sp. TaxID=1667 RepID=UPI003471E98A